MTRRNVRARALRAPGRFSADLLAWYDRDHRPLPWRADRAPYHRWIAEVVLQQTRVAQAVGRYERFIARFPDVRALAGATEAEVLKAWEGAGYYARARHLHAAARHLTAGRRVRWPSTSAQWAALPGVGPYIARALGSQLSDEPVVAMEANARRVAARWTLERGDPRVGIVARRLAARLSDWLPPRRAGTFNEAIMELGETICRPVRPRCPECPIRWGCQARRELADPGSIPARRARPLRPAVRAAVAGLVRDGRWLVHRRPTGGLLGGLWELPGGKLEFGETAEAAVRREVREETGLSIRGLERAGSVEHSYSHFSVDLAVFRGTPSGRLRPEGRARSFRWVTREEFELLPRPAATVKAARLVGMLTRLATPGRSPPRSTSEGRARP
ncbi:MAG TPA: NUDIX domain-containing protein [Thermoplasmata archaeon]|nr:NUDIX domain-containing protein [Thermoplasmata archaeon]